MPRASATWRSIARARRRRRWRQRAWWALWAVAIAASVWRFGVLWTVIGVAVAIPMLIAGFIAWLVLMMLPLMRRSPHREQADELGKLVKLTHKRHDRARALEHLAELHQLAVRYPTEPLVAIEVMGAATGFGYRSMDPELRNGLLDDAERALDACGVRRVPRMLGATMLRCLESMRDSGDDGFEARRAALEDRLLGQARYLRKVRIPRRPSAVA